ncbi:MAG: hypothetical protein GMKNLPBB_01629 [Myxococcota bacterium]|nr:hypothetical protein [Myxococcota bacterium]
MLFCLIAALLTAGCGSAPYEISLRAEPSSIPADGKTSAKIEAYVSRDRQPMKGRVRFTTDLGTFKLGEELTTSDVDLDANGGAIVRLFAGKQGGTASVSVLWAPTGEQPTTKTVQIEIRPPPIITSMEFRCDSKNIGAYVPKGREILVKCDVLVKNNKGGLLRNAPVEFKAEAGTMEKRQNDDGETVYLYSPKTGDPADVDPIAGEPSYRDAKGQTRNPRDGLVTIIAMLPFGEAYNDSNGNGVRDRNERFEDQGEPLVDSNDNGVWDKGEFFVDFNESGKWDAPNGRHDPEGYMWVRANILWTGALNESVETSRIEPTSILVKNGGAQTFTIHMTDQNLNPLAANDPSSDQVQIDVSGGRTKGATEIALSNELGVEFDESGAVIGGFDKFRSYTITIEDSDSSQDQKEDASIAVEVQYTPAPSSDFYSPESITAKLKPISGSVN